MNMRTATVEKEWAEVRRPGRGKVEDWSWTVTYFYHGMMADRHYIKTEADAKFCVALYEAGEFDWTDYDGVEFGEVFA
jgi:hypothetical protein